MMRRCLIVDQSPMVCRVASRIIRDLEFKVDEARTGREALDMCQTSMPHVVMLDWKTPDMEGADFIARLKELSQMAGTPMPTVLFCTAERQVEQIVSALKAGADEYIMKPFDSDIIESKFALAGLLDGDDVRCVAH